MDNLCNATAEAPVLRRFGRRRSRLRRYRIWCMVLSALVLPAQAAESQTTGSLSLRRLPPVVGTAALDPARSTDQENSGHVLLPGWTSSALDEPHDRLPRSLFESEVLPASYRVGNGPIVPPTAARAFDQDDDFFGQRDDCWEVQFMPDGLIYRSYLAGVKEPRFASQWVYERNQGWIWDIALGGRVGILRYGTNDPRWPQGWQADVEGAAFPRLDLEEERDLMAADFRFGIPLTYGVGPFQTKLGYYHLSSHLGDELMLKHPGVPRINYSRDVLVWGNSFYWTKDLRLYAEAAYAFYRSGGAEPWEFQFGVDYSPSRPTHWRGAPFVAINGHLREELDFGGNVVVQTGWQWRGVTGHLFRLGMHYYAGGSEQFEFFRQYEDKLGLGIWYDY